MRRLERAGACHVRTRDEPGEKGIVDIHLLLIRRCLGALWAWLSHNPEYCLLVFRRIAIAGSQANWSRRGADGAPRLDRRLSLLQSDLRELIRQVGRCCSA